MQIIFLCMVVLYCHLLFQLPPSIQSLLEQEPLGLSPAMTVLVTLTTFVMFLSITCFSCLCSSVRNILIHWLMGWLVSCPAAWLVGWMAEFLGKPRAKVKIGLRCRNCANISSHSLHMVLLLIFMQRK